MEGPTPVSALLHAATMVTAGVFLLMRCSFFFEQSPCILFIVILFGILTAYFFSFCAIFQNDVKKIIAYSTCSQLGYMFFACGISQYHGAFFHLFNHSFFKALLFLSAGLVIHSLCDEQDSRRMGLLCKSLPFVYLCFVIGSLAISGIPFTTGFFSKDLIIEFGYSRYILDGFFIYYLAVTSAFFTSVYSTKLLFFVFQSDMNCYRSYLWDDANDRPAIVPLFFLCILSMVAGYICADLYSGPGTFLFSNTFVNNPIYCYTGSSEIDNISPFVKNIPFFLTLVGILLSIFMSSLYEKYAFSIYLIFGRFFYESTSFGFYVGYFN